jgi:hypothetical protein
LLVSLKIFTVEFAAGAELKVTVFPDTLNAVVATSLIDAFTSVVSM